VLTFIVQVQGRQAFIQAARKQGRQGVNMTCETTTGSVYEDSTFSLMARFEVDGANATQADCSSITIKAWDMSDFGTQVLSATLVVADVVFDALQTDGRWSEDSTGYNFRYDVADTVCTVPGARYRFESVVTTSGGKLPPMVWEVLCLETRSS